MIKSSLFLTAVVFAATAANAVAGPNDTVTTLPTVNGTYGLGVATTTTTPNGTSTTVVGPGGDSNRLYQLAPANTWHQSAVGGGATVGITNNYARSGNGSAFFQSVSGDSKADLQYNFSAAVPLSSLSTISFDFLRDFDSGVDAKLAPVMRLDIRKDGVFAGSLVFENVYQTQANAPVDTWTTLTGNLNSGIFWATNSRLGPTFADANGGQKTLASWIDGNAGANLTVTGMSIGVGSGWNGVFIGAVDNVVLGFNDGQRFTANFEVPTAGAVPEPATWAMLIGGFGLVGGTMRRRVSKVAFA